MSASPRVSLASALLLSVGACTESVGSGLVVNEIQAHGPAWVELANSTDQPLDVSGVGLCDEDSDGYCDILEAMVFPEGTTIPANGYVVVLTEQDPAVGVGPHAQCSLLPGVTRCFFATWKVNSTSDNIRVVDANFDPNDEALSKLLYPWNGTVDGTTSWSRVPDITGRGQLGQPTPGAANATATATATPP